MNMLSWFTHHPVISNIPYGLFSRFFVLDRCGRFVNDVSVQFKVNCQSSNRTEFLALVSIQNVLLDGAVNPNPAPLALKSIRRLWARSNSPRRPCCRVCWPSFPSAMFAEDPATGWLLFLKPPIKRRNLACRSELSNCAVPHWPRFYKHNRFKSSHMITDLNADSGHKYTRRKCLDVETNRLRLRFLVDVPLKGETACLGNERVVVSTWLVCGLC